MTANGHGAFGEQLGAEFRRLAGSPTVRSFPPHDPAFATFAQRLATRVLAEGVPLRDAPATLQERLRVLYPRAIVHARDSLADVGVTSPIWYVYRSGRYATASADGTWWSDPRLPRVTIDSEGRHIAANAAALEVLGASVDELTRTGFRPFCPPEGLAHARTLPSFVNGTPLVSELAVLRRDGTRLHVEFHLSRDPQTDHLEAVFRLVPEPLDAEATE